MEEVLEMPGKDCPIEKMPGHWLLARLGKKVLRPGGKALTKEMLQALQINSRDRVVEFAPGLGFTAKLCLQQGPQKYTAIEQNKEAARLVNSYLNGEDQTCKIANAQDTGLEAAGTDVVYCEAMLTMQSDHQKAAIIAEAARILGEKGRYGVHELCIVPNDIDEDKMREIQKAVVQAIQSPATPLTPAAWKEKFRDSGFSVVYEKLAPMHLLELRRMIDDEGIAGVLKIAKNLLRSPKSRSRLLGMYRVFRKYRDNLAAIALVSNRQG